MKIIVSVSGGKDSTALLLNALESFPKENITPVFCDTQWEPDEVYYYLEYLESKLDVEIIRIETEGMVGLSKRKRMMPNRVMRFCTENLKIRPFQKWLYENYASKGIEFIVFQGIRREESAARANTPIYKNIDSLVRPKFKILSLYPIVDWTKDEVFDYIKEKGLRPNPLYERGYTRVGCMPCIFANKWELSNMEEKYKNRLRDLEGEISNLLAKPVKFFQSENDRYIRQELLFNVEKDVFKCERCGAEKYFEDFCAECFKKEKNETG